MTAPFIHVVKMYDKTLVLAILVDFFDDSYYLLLFFKIIDFYGIIYPFIIIERKHISLSHFCPILTQTDHCQTLFKSVHPIS